MKKIILTGIFLVLVSTLKIPARSCFYVAAGNDTTITCSWPFLHSKARIPDVITTDDYKVVQIPYTFFAFIHAWDVVRQTTML